MGRSRRRRPPPASPATNSLEDGLAQISSTHRESSAVAGAHPSNRFSVLSLRIATRRASTARSPTSSLDTNLPLGSPLGDSPLGTAAPTSSLSTSSTLLTRRRRDRNASSKRADVSLSPLAYLAVSARTDSAFAPPLATRTSSTYSRMCLGQSRERAEGRRGRVREEGAELASDVARFPAAFLAAADPVPDRDGESAPSSAPSGTLRRLLSISASVASAWSNHEKRRHGSG